MIEIKAKKNGNEVDINTHFEGSTYELGMELAAAFRAAQENIRSMDITAYAIFAAQLMNDKAFSPLEMKEVKNNEKPLES